MSRPVTSARVATVVALLGALVFVAVAWWRVPWHPVPGGNPPTLPAPGTILSAAQLERADDYSGPARILGYSSLAVSLAVACLLGFTRLGRLLVGWLRGWWWVRVVLGVAAVALVGRLVTLPFAIVGHHRNVEFGLSDQAWSGWLRDVGVGWLVGVVGSSLVLLVVVGTARRWPRWWPAVAGGLAAALVMLGSLVYPVVVEPLFNHFTPLPAGSLRTGVLHLAEVEGVHVDDVLEADASRRTTTLNAYVSGYGSTRRVVLYDNLVEDVPEDQVLSVVAHELGHARHDDVLTGSLLGAAGAAFGVGLLGLVLGAGRRTPRGEAGQSVGPAAEPAVVPRVLAMLAIASLLASPIQNGISRRIETRADVDALEATRDPRAFIEVQRQLALRSLSDLTPPAWSQFWFGSHPTTRERIAIAGWLSDRRG